jgi:hypothetical protein
MAKSLRSKYKRRMRSVKRDHYWEIEGKQKLQTLSNKLLDPTYDFKNDGSLPPNAFVEPNNPAAVFPQYARPHIIDFRAHKMAASGFATIGNFRKIMSERAKKSKYTPIVKTKEEMDAEAELLNVEQEMKAHGDDDGSDEEIDIDKVKKSYTVEDIMTDMNKQMKLSKKKNKNKEVEMTATKVIEKPERNSRNKMLKEKSKRKRSRSLLMH